MSAIYDTIVNDILVLVATDVNSKTEDGKASFPELTSEKPSKLALAKWCDTWTQDLKDRGYAALLRDSIPFELAKLKPKPEIVISATQD